MAFIGPSGCGKSTVLRTLNRMHEVIPGARVEGSVLLDGDDIYGSGVDPVGVRKTVGMVFQRPNPFPTMSIRDNVVAGLKLQGVRNRKVLQETVEQSLKGANLWNEVKDRLDEPGGGLSGGQQQRLCIARAIAVQPEVLLMDEPCSALDPISTLAIEDLIAELKQDFTIVIVTHNMQQAARVSDMTAFYTTEVNPESDTRTGLLVEYAGARGCAAILRGIRSVKDFEYEQQMAVMNAHLAPDIETIFLMSEPALGHISSSLIKEVARFGGAIDDHVPPHIAQALRARYANA